MERSSGVSGSLWTGCPAPAPAADPTRGMSELYCNCCPTAPKMRHVGPLETAAAASRAAAAAVAANMVLLGGAVLWFTGGYGCESYDKHLWCRAHGCALARNDKCCRDHKVGVNTQRVHQLRLYLLMTNEPALFACILCPAHPASACQIAD